MVSMKRNVLRSRGERESNVYTQFLPVTPYNNPIPSYFYTVSVHYVACKWRYAPSVMLILNKIIVTSSTVRELSVAILGCNAGVSWSGGEFRGQDPQLRPE